MIEKLLAMYIAPTAILLLIIGIVLYDKRIDWRKRKKAKKILDSVDFSGDKNPATKPGLKERVLRRLAELPNDASLRDIRDAANQAAVEQVPEDIFNKALEVFEGEKEVVGWLTSRVVALGGRSPIEVLQQDDGKELVLTLLERIEYGVYS